MATALILMAIAWIIEGRRWRIVPMLLVAFLIHPIMAALGISFCFFLTLALWEPVHVWLQSLSPARATSVAAAFAPLSWVFEPQSPTWRTALDTRSYYFLYKWHWYEWLGALAPLFLFWLLWRVAQKRGETLLARFAMAVFVYGVFQQAVAMTVLGFPALVRLTPLQPMRYLHLVYFFLALTAGCLLGKSCSRRSVWRWAVFLLSLNGCMFAAQRAEFGGSQHIEWPGRAPANPVATGFCMDPR